MAEEITKVESMPRKLWDGAVKMVKGDNTAQLVERFTAEMTLIAEGLSEDQSNLHREVDRMMTEEDQRIQRLSSRIDLLETQLEEERANHDRDLTELRTRLAEVEKQASKIPEKEKEKEKEKKKPAGIIRELTLLVSIAAGAWIIVTILNLLK